MSEGSAGREDESNVPFVAVVDAMPMSSDEVKYQFESLLNANPKALVIQAYATGTTQESFNPYIEQCKERGIPVFLLSKNLGRDTGIQKISYGPQEETVKAGAIPLRDVNANRTLDVVETIQTTVKQGLTGARLSEAIVNRFGTPPVPAPAK